MRFFAYFLLDGRIDDADVLVLFIIFLMASLGGWAAGEHNRDLRRFAGLLSGIAAGVVFHGNRVPSV